MHRLLRLGVFSFLLFLGGDPARGTVLRGLSLTQLCDRSPTILRGQVVRTASSWRGGRIYTAVSLRVDAPLSGAHRAGEVVTFWRLGGEVGRIGQRVLGAPRFHVGEQVIVFLHARRGHLFVTGMVQGKVRVLPATPTAPARVMPGAGRVQLYGPKRALARVQPLSTFETAVRRLVRTRAQRRGRRP